MTTSTVLVTGGTGTLGRLVVARLRDEGRDVRVLTRARRATTDGVHYFTGDLATGANVAAAVNGVETIVHCAGSRTGDAEATRNLVRAATSRSRRPHLISISVVGADRVPVLSAFDRASFSYFPMKLQTESVVEAAGLPWTLLRATQFHDLILMVARMLTKLPIVPVPAGFRFQPIDADEVAARLVELVHAGPSGRVPDVGGPEILSTADLMRAFLRATRRRRLLLPIWLPGASARAVRNGANLAPVNAVGQRTWEEFLAARAT